jgi:hypothetical protein
MPMATASMARTAWRPVLAPERGRPAAEIDLAAPLYRVMPLSAAGPVMPRLLHGLGTRSATRFIARGAAVVTEIAGAAILDLAWPRRVARPVVEAGRARHVGDSLALFLHWSPDGRVSGMVRRQLALWREHGFTVVFVSNAKVPAADRDAVAEHAALLILRGNAGRDFGAWRDAFAIATRRFGMPRELLLANDSVLGPVRPLTPIVDAWRRAGEGMFGMTENIAPRPHLQSYLLLAAGERAVASAARHLLGFRDSRSKWRIVQKGEIALSARAIADGICCGAVFDYAASCRAIDPLTRRELGSRFVEEGTGRHWPLNPTIHLWRPLVAQLGFPYLKRDLLRAMPDATGPSAAWRPLVGDGDAALIVDHLRIMGVR